MKSALAASALLLAGCAAAAPLATATPASRVVVVEEAPRRCGWIDPFQNIHFEPDSAMLVETYADNSATLAGVLAFQRRSESEGPHARYLLWGGTHMCETNDGSDAFRLERAKAVAAYLVAHGVPPRDISLRPSGYVGSSCFPDCRSSAPDPERAVHISMFSCEPPVPVVTWARGTEAER